MVFLPDLPDRQWLLNIKTYAGPIHLPEFDIDMKNSLLIGDKERDIEAAIGAGIENTILFSNKSTDTKALRVIGSYKELKC